MQCRIIMSTPDLLSDRSDCKIAAKVGSSTWAVVKRSLSHRHGIHWPRYLQPTVLAIVIGQKWLRVQLTIERQIDNDTPFIVVDRHCCMPQSLSLKSFGQVIGQMTVESGIRAVWRSEYVIRKTSHIKKKGLQRFRSSPFPMWALLGSNQ
jgi:hypothetical protein